MCCCTASVTWHTGQLKTRERNASSPIWGERSRKKKNFFWNFFFTFFLLCQWISSICAAAAAPKDLDSNDSRWHPSKKKNKKRESFPSTLNWKKNKSRYRRMKKQKKKRTFSFVSRHHQRPFKSFFFYSVLVDDAQVSSKEMKDHLPNQ